jgi:hypothetical protein
MAINSNFKNANVPNIPYHATNFVTIYTAPAGVVSYFLHINVASLGAGGQVSIRVWDDSVGSYTYLVKGGAVPAGSALLGLVESNKLVLEGQDRLEVKSDSPGINFDVQTSFVEDVNA